MAVSCASPTRCPSRAAWGTGFSDFFEQFFGGRTGQPHGASLFDSEEFANGRGAPRGSSAGPRHSRRHLSSRLMKCSTERCAPSRCDARIPKAGREETDTYQVRIPRRVENGQSIRLSGKGGEGSNGGSAGDITLRVRYAQHPDFQVRGFDLIGQLKLAPWEAVLGAGGPSSRRRAVSSLVSSTDSCFITV